MPAGPLASPTVTAEKGRAANTPATRHDAAQKPPDATSKARDTGRSGHSTAPATPR